MAWDQKQADRTIREATAVFNDSMSIGFSWNRCQCCGDSDGGNRSLAWAVTVRGQHRTQRAMDICDDCVMYIEYGMTPEED
jgi:hypothetical protein